MPEITLIAPGGIRAALQQLLPIFEQATGHKVAPTFASGGATKAKTVAGERFDVPVLQPPLVSVIASGNVDARSETPLATVSVVLAMRAGAAQPDISNAEGVKRLLLTVPSIACPNAAAGAACGVSFEATLTKLGITETVAPKIKPAPSGWEAIKMLARGEVELGITFESENDPDPDVAMLGALPREISTPTGFVAFVHARSPEPKAATALVQFLGSAAAAKIFRACGMTPGT
ncbi:MAG TPA: substrate-binding domain-containing protein [Stellaceae bacterium]|nr:substrate-binding domain-containing protein [Stellaceae bacterium]